MGFLSKLKEFGAKTARANSANLAGWVEGSVTELKKGKRQVDVTNGEVHLFIVGEDDITLTKKDVKSVEEVATDLHQKYGNKIMVCNSYIVHLKNGKSGNFTIFKGKVADFLMALK